MTVRLGVVICDIPVLLFDDHPDTLSVDLIHCNVPKIDSLFLWFLVCQTFNVNYWNAGCEATF